MKTRVTLMREDDQLDGLMPMAATVMRALTHAGYNVVALDNSMSNAVELTVDGEKGEGIG